MKILFLLVVVISVLILGCDDAVSPTGTLPTEEITEHDMWGYLSGKWELSEPVEDLKKQSLNFDGSTKTVEFQEVISSPAIKITALNRTITIPANNATANAKLAVKTYKKGSVEVISLKGKTLAFDYKTSVFNYTVQRKSHNDMMWTLISFDDDPPKSLKPFIMYGERVIYRYHRVPSR